MRTDAGHASVSLGVMNTNMHHKSILSINARTFLLQRIQHKHLFYNSPIFLCTFFLVRREYISMTQTMMGTMEKKCTHTNDVIVKVCVSHIIER